MAIDPSVLTDEENVALAVLRQYAGSDGPSESASALYRAAEANCEGRPYVLGLVRLAGLELKLPELAWAQEPAKADDWPVEVGRVVRLGPQGLWWLVRACSPNGRYALLTTVIPGGEDGWTDGGVDRAIPGSPEYAVAYTLIDRDEQVRGAINVIGGGCGIETVCGPDEAVAEAMRMVLEDGFEVSHRNQVRLEILAVRPAC